MFGCLDLHVSFDGASGKSVSQFPYSTTFQYSSLVLIFATDALSGLCVQRVAVLFAISHRSPTEGSFTEILLVLPHVFFLSILTQVPPPPLGPTAFPVILSSPSSLLVTLCSGESALTVTRPSNRDCACLRSSRDFKVGSYPS